MDEEENCNRFIINFPTKSVCKGINVSWGVGSHLVAHRCNFENPSKCDRRTSSAVFLQEVRWDLNLHNCVARKLVNESHLMFRQMQELEPETTESIGKNPQLINFSRNYRSVLRACILELKQGIKSNLNKKELENQMQVYTVMELIWSMCEILFVENLVPGAILLHLLDWCSWHFTKANDLLTEITSSTVEHHNHPQYWNSFYCLLLQGRMSDAQKVLSMHPKYQTSDYDPFSSLDELIRKMPKFSFSRGQSIGEFEMKWHHWQDECKRRMATGEFDMNVELKTGARILAGEEKVFEELKELTGTWYHTLISYLFFTRPTVSVEDIQQYSKYTIDMFGGQTNFSALDHILLAALELDIFQVIKECSQQLSNWWLPAHLTDLFYYCGLATQRNLSFGKNLRESLIVEYASSLMAHQSLWLVVVEYLSACPENKTQYLTMFIERIPPISEKKALKLLRVCERLQLQDVAQSICRKMAVKALKQNRLGCALTWSLKSNNSTFTVHVSNKMLENYSKTGQFIHSDLLDHLGNSVFMSERLTFLGKYREFFKLQESDLNKEAADLLLNLLNSKMAPMNFWPILFGNALTFLDSDELIYNSDDTAKLLISLNILHQNMDTLFSEQTPAARENMDRKMEDFRLALVRNLARALVHTRTA